ncbi:putative f-box domain cyclin-like protein [Diaporthe ampelina]|uniref:Putative f-box domain cyclin-like protein n=1 Tax=Diaporthe ampelina TaxID=1214573 RepID=A0A0G2IF35_9PEZI|nr:putative f-box domain cyclin-like protein [Diaporthe ampelina]
MAAPDSVTWDFDQASQMGAKNPSSSTIVRNLREMLKDPRALEAIQHVALRGAAQIKHLENSFLTDNLAPHETETLKAWVSELQVPQDKLAPASRGQGGCGSPSVARAVVAVLSRLSGLKTLEVHTFDRTAEDEEAQLRPAGDPFTACLLHLISSPPPGFGRALETARILVPRPDDDPADEMDYYVYPSSLVPLFGLPGVRRIEAHRVDDGGARPAPAATPDAVATCHTLRELRLVRCQLTEETLGLVLPASPGLTALHCDLVLDAEHVGGWFDLGRVRASLDGLRGSLEDLSLALNLWSSTAIDCGDKGPWGIRGSLGSLRDFGRLARLSVSLPVLLGWRVQGSGRLADVLPAGIRSLTITNEMFFWWRYQWDAVDWDKRGGGSDIPRWRWIEEKILEYLGSRPGSLEELVLDVSTAGEADRGAQLRDALVSRGQDVGVKVILHLRSS